MRVLSKFSMTVLPLFLGATLLIAQEQSQQPSSPPQSQQDNPPQTPPPAAKKPSTADENPFPEDISRKAAEGDTNSPENKPPTSAGKQGSPSTTAPNADSSSRSELRGMGNGIDNESRISNGAGGYIEDPKLAAQDVKVGGFYLDQQDYQGAYSRYKEATLVDPGNADAVFGLAEAARGLKHKDEAVQNYRLYLDVVASGKKAKEARKALADLGAPAIARK
jgi:tetratricopeptide (TPR) repeat protein